MKRALSPSLNSTGIGAAAAAIYAAVQMIVNLAGHKSGYGFDPQVMLAALGAAWFLYARFVVTPVADPRDGNGKPLIGLQSTMADVQRAAAASSNVTVIPPEPKP